ncbi:hypothetical protein [Streptomyces sp. NBC_01353]|uniref:hypothetical protein n=1 Tax=Streptomyces sp. NBC_01353 TaxID=2903835 RepID=UPI002E33D099|nr:hypothetical protein [Streptomyces sp. NBC_01353]
MSASEKSNNSNARSGGSRAGSNGSGTRERAARGSGDAVKAASDAKEETTATLTALPAPIAEKTLATAQAVRGVVGPGGWLWAALRARKGLAGGSAASTVALVTGAYALGRRAGLRRRGPISRLTGGRI